VQCKALNTYEDIIVQVDNGCFQTLEQTLIVSQDLGFYFYFLKKYLVLKNLLNLYIYKILLNAKWLPISKSNCQFQSYFILRSKFQMGSNLG